MENPDSEERNLQSEEEEEKSKVLKLIERISEEINNLLTEESKISKTVKIEALRKKINKILQAEKKLSKAETLLEKLKNLFEIELFEIPTHLKLNKKFRELLSLHSEGKTRMFEEMPIQPKIEEIEKIDDNSIIDWTTLIDGSAYKGQYNEELEIKEGYGIHIDPLGNLCWGLFLKNQFYRGNMLHSKEMTFIRTPQKLNFLINNEAFEENFSYECKMDDRDYEVENSVSIDMINIEKNSFNYCYGETKNGKLHGHCAVCCEDLGIPDSKLTGNYYKDLNYVSDFRAEFNQNEIQDGELDVKYSKGFNITFMTKNKKIVDITLTYPFCYILNPEEIKNSTKFIPEPISEILPNILKLKGEKEENLFELKALDIQFFYKDVYPVSGSLVINSPKVIADNSYFSLISYRGINYYKKYGEYIHQNGLVFNSRFSKMWLNDAFVDLINDRIVDSKGRNFKELKKDFFYVKNLLSTNIPSLFKMYNDECKTPEYFRETAKKLGILFEDINNFHVFVSCYECLDRIFYRFKAKGEKYVVLDDKKDFIFWKLKREENELVNFGVSKVVSYAEGKVVSEEGYVYEGEFKIFVNENKSIYYSVTWNFDGGIVNTRGDKQEFIKISKNDENELVLESGFVKFYGGFNAEFLTVEDENTKLRVLKGKFSQGDGIFEEEILTKNDLITSKRTGYCYILKTTNLNKIQLNLLKVNKHIIEESKDCIEAEYYSYIPKRNIKGIFTSDVLCLKSTEEEKKNFRNKSKTFGPEKKNALYLSDFANISEISRIVTRTYFFDLERKNYNFIDEIEFYGLFYIRRKGVLEFGLDNYDFEVIKGIKEEFDIEILDGGKKLVKEAFGFEVDSGGFGVVEGETEKRKCKIFNLLFYL